MSLRIICIMLPVLLEHVVHISSSCNDFSRNTTILAWTANYTRESNETIALDPIEGESLDLNCCAEGYTNIAWEKLENDGSPRNIDMITGLNAYRKTRNQTLHFKEIIKKHESSKFRCIVRNATSFKTRNFLIDNVRGECTEDANQLARLVKVENTTIIEKSIGESVSFMCEAYYKGCDHGLVAFHWVKKGGVFFGERVNSTKTFRGVKIYQTFYTIDAINSSHYGEYLCMNLHDKITYILQEKQTSVSSILVIVFSIAVAFIVIFIVFILVNLYLWVRIKVVFKQFYISIFDHYEREGNYDVFILAADYGTDSLLAVALGSYLEKCGRHVYIYERNSVPGEYKSTNYINAVHESSCVLAIITERFIESRLCYDALEEARRDGKRVAICIYNNNELSTANWDEELQTYFSACRKFVWRQSFYEFIRPQLNSSDRNMNRAAPHIVPAVNADDTAVDKSSSEPNVDNEIDIVSTGADSGFCAKLKVKFQKRKVQNDFHLFKEELLLYLPKAINSSSGMVMTNIN
ncbi:uncharacterized protein LOC141901598 [Tubulanus polymorphus]|uniref:uncharacterized protein LOC141901598 n=1 Tax=Tubulanus polymorphus TaxID=672921 RepID=UPI003DA3D736